MQDDEWARSGHGWATENLTGNPLPFNQSDCGTGPSEIERHCLLDMGLTAEDVRDVTLGWRKTTAMAMRAVHAAGGWVWQMFTERRAATTGDECAKAYRGACTAGSKDQTHMCSYSLTLSDRHSPGSTTDPEGDVAKFLVQRGPYGFLGTAWVGCVGEGKSRHSNETYVRAAAFDRDYGTPLGLCKEVSDGVFRREFTKATASHDCNTGKSSVTMKSDDICSAAAHMGCGGGHDLVGLRSAPKVHTAAACCAVCKRTPNCTGRQTACAKRRPLSAPGRCSPRRRGRGRGPASWSVVPAGKETAGERT
jgi:hypothetical protein